MAKFDSVQFVTIQLNKSDKKSFDTWADSKADDILTLTSHMCDAGYKLSASFDMENGCYIVAVTGKKTASNNVNMCFTSRSSEYEEAVLLALYKHWELAEGGDWGTIATSNNNWG